MQRLSESSYRPLSQRTQIGRQPLTVVCRMPVDFPSNSCSFKNKSSPCMGRKCCGL